MYTLALGVCGIRPERGGTLTNSRSRSHRDPLPNRQNWIRRGRGQERCLVMPSRPMRMLGKRGPSAGVSTVRLARGSTHDAIVLVHHYCIESRALQAGKVNVRYACVSADSGHGGSGLRSGLTGGLSSEQLHNWSRASMASEPQLSTCAEDLSPPFTSRGYLFCCSFHSRIQSSCSALVRQPNVSRCPLRLQDTDSLEALTSGRNSLGRSTPQRCTNGAGSVGIRSRQRWLTGGVVDWESVKCRWRWRVVFTF